MRHPIRLTVNGEVHDAEVEARTLLVQFLREHLGFTGTHVGCVVGECGACSVLVDNVLVKSCLMLAIQRNGGPPEPWHEQVDVGGKEIRVPVGAELIWAKDVLWNSGRP